MSLSENLQCLRRERGLSQEDVANKLYVSRQSVSKWENGAAEPGVDNLKALAKLYGVTLDELVNGSDGAGAAGGLEFSPEPPRDTPPPAPAKGFKGLWRDMGRAFAAPAPGTSGPAYGVLIAFRAVTVLFFCIMEFAEGSINIPLDFILMLIGVGVAAPWVWGLMWICEAFEVVAHLLSLSSSLEDHMLGVIVCAVFLLVLSRPALRKRFNL